MKNNGFHKLPIRMLAILLTIALILCLGGFALAAEEILVALDTVTGTPGDTVRVGFNLSATSGWGALQATLRYDASKLTFVEAGKGTQLAALTGIQSFITYGTPRPDITLAAIALPDVTRAGQMVYADFSINAGATGSAAVWLENAVITNGNTGVQLSPQLTAGGVTILPAGSVAVSGVTLSPQTLGLTAGETSRLTATVAPSNATDKTVNWSSNALGVAAVDQNGNVTATGVGTATITATTRDGSFAATCAVAVGLPVVPVTGVALSLSTLALNQGNARTLVATVAPTNATNRAVTWASSNPAVATVNANGVVNALSGGSTNITATTVDGGFVATCPVTVTATNVPVTGVTLTRTLALTIGTTGPLTATVLPAAATNRAVTFASGNPAVATVDAAGNVTALAAGTATITVTTLDGGYTATCTVTVTAPRVPVTGVTLNKQKIALTVGESATLAATVAPTNATDKTLTWSIANTAIANTAIATVDTAGKVTAKTPGSTAVTATTRDGSFAATCEVIVEDAAPSATGTVINCNEWVNVRSGPSSLVYGVLGQAPRASVYALLSTTPINGYYQINFNGQTGYIYQDYFQVDSGSTPAPTPVATGTVINCNEWVNVRSGPSLTLYPIVGRANKGATYDVYSKTPANGYYQVNFGGSVGFIAQEYLQLQDLPTPGVSYYAKVINVNEWVNVRSGPSTTLYPVIGRAPLASTYPLLADAPENGFYKLDFGGQTGYIRQDYVEIVQKSMSTTTATIANCSYAVNVYADCDTSGAVLGIALLDATYTLVDATPQNGRIAIQYNGATGYVQQRFLQLA